MASNINFLGINPDFPVAGQDNDTQVFRDNFSTIRQSFNDAKDEITDLQNNTAKLNENNDFDLNLITNAVLQNTRSQRAPLGTPATAGEIDFSSGYYFDLDLNRDLSFEITNFPGDPNILPSSSSLIGVGKALLEVRSDGGAKLTSLSEMTTGRKHQITILGDTNWSAIGASGSPTVGEIFTKNSTAATGTGSVTASRLLTLTVNNAAAIRTSSNFPVFQKTLGSVSIEILHTNTVSSLFEIWRYSADTVFINYLGQFS